MSLITDNYQWDIQYTGGTPVTGTFLDGTPWVYPNGATLVLVGVSPGQTLAAPEIQNYSLGHPTDGPYYSGVTLPVGGTYASIHIMAKLKEMPHTEVFRMIMVRLMKM